MEPISNRQIHTLIANGLENADISVEGDGYKYQVNVISDEFNDKSTLQRHKLVYALLQEPIAAGQLHALTIKTYTRAEWEKTNS